jgi:penicillin-binding protein 1C
VNDFYRYLKKAGFAHMDREPSYYGPGLALGTGGVSLLHLCRIYSGIACSGVMHPLFIGAAPGVDIVLGEKTVLFSEKTSYRLTHMLSDKSARRRAFGSRNFLDFPFDVAVKTGTSKDFRDAWTVGFTDRYVVGVWVGNFSGKQMNNFTGGWGAGRIFHQVVRLVTGRNGSAFPVPEGFRMVKFCRVTGLTAGKNCQYFMEPVCADEQLLPLCTVCGAGGSYSTYYTSGDEPEIISPANGESFIIDPLRPLKDQHIPLTILLNKISVTSGNYFYTFDDQKPVLLKGRIDRTFEPVRGKHSIKILKEGTVIKNVMFTVQ